MLRRILLLFILLTFGCAREGSTQKVRQSLVAGGFYPADAGELKTMVQQLLAGTQAPRIRQRIIALIAPHAGYVYSGHVAAESFVQLRGRKINRVVVIAPSHVDYFEGASVYDGTAYATPLGKVELDQDFCQRLARQSSRIFRSGRGHDAPPGQRGEHALEVELPFLQTVLPHFKLVPIVMGEQSYATCRALGVALAKLIKDTSTVIVASSDLSHYHSYKDCKHRDGKVLQAIREWDYYSLSRNFSMRVWEACGGGPIVATMIAAERLGANRAKLLKYANSGDVPGGDKSRVVGYSAWAFYRDRQKKSQAEEDFSLNRSQREQLLQIARKAVETVVTSGETYQPPQPKDEALRMDRGAFVTLTEQGRLRGCIGYTSPVKPLYLTVRDVAIEAALHDPRFAPVQESELSLLHYEISVLSPFHHVRDVNEIRVGRDGLLIWKDGRAGLLLPQVPVGLGWDRTTFLEQTCRKAGLSKDAWKDPAGDLFRFTAFVFSEED